jgi:hypothetical protein
MSPSTFTLRVPVATPFSLLAGAVAMRFLELWGATADDAARFEDEVGRAATRVSSGADAIDCTFVSDPSGVEATLVAGVHRETVRFSRP